MASKLTVAEASIVSLNEKIATQFHEMESLNSEKQQSKDREAVAKHAVEKAREVLVIVRQR